MSNPNPLPVPSSQERTLLVRILYMLVFGFIFWLTGTVLAVITILQLVLVLFTRQRNTNLIKAGNALARYCAQIIRFLTFATDTPPFPFGDWPGEPG